MATLDGLRREMERYDAPTSEDLGRWYWDEIHCFIHAPSTPPELRDWLIRTLYTTHSPDNNETEE